MSRNKLSRFGSDFLLCAMLLAAQVGARSLAQSLPDPLSLQQVVEIAVSNRPEVSAANARAEALAQRPVIVGALEDPMIAPSVDHYPFEMMEEEGGARRYDWSVTVEQRFPLSSIRRHRQAAARADAQRAGALAQGTALDVALDAQQNFFMLLERRRMSEVVSQQLQLARELVSVVTSRYAQGVATQADVLRAEVELARLSASQRTLAAEVRAAEAMLNASIGRGASEPIPALRHATRTEAPAPAPTVLDQALNARPELAAGSAEMERAAAEIEVMRSMYKPMAMVRVGRASTMAEGAGAMVMVGVSVPIWRERLRAGVAEANAMRRMAAADLAAMRRMVEGESLAARESVIAAQTQASLIEHDVAPRARAALDAALANYAAGRDTLIAVVESARALWEVQAEQVMADVELGAAWARLERAMGGAGGAQP